MNRFRITILLLAAAGLIGVSTAIYFAYEWPPQSSTASANLPFKGEAVRTSQKVIVGEQAQKNLALSAKPLRAEVFWKTVTIQGMVVDRPGFSDREIVSPVVGNIREMFHVPGDMVGPGDKLFTLTLASDSIQQTQANLFKTSQDIPLAQANRDRLVSAGQAIPRIEVVEVENEILRLRAAVKAYRHELMNRGFTADEIDGVASGQLISEITLVAPPRPSDASSTTATPNTANRSVSDRPAPYEFQELNVELGEQVQAGKTLCRLSNHQSLAIEGRAFRDETTLLERSVQKQWPVEIDFQEDVDAVWPSIDQTFYVSYIANTIDPTTRTFAFLIPLENQYRAVPQGDRKQLLWRFRPGQKVLIRLRVEELSNVFVLPAAAVVLEGADAYVFTQNVNTFERKGVHVVYRDRERVVIANDGALTTYTKDGEQRTIPAIAQAAAAQLNRLTKAGSTDVPKGYHIHADGSLHNNEDEGK